MWRFILRRLALAVPVMLVVVTITFFLIRLAPGGPFDQERNVPPEVLANINAQYNLDQPLAHQYVNYLGNLVRGDLGPSYRYPSRSVNEMIGSGLPITLELGLYAILFALLVGMPAGIIASLRPNSLQDYVPMSLSMVGICLPSFVLGPMLILCFGIWLGWLPISGWGHLSGDKILPTITLGSTYAAYIARITRGGMLEVLSQDYIRTARAKGLSLWRIVTVHALRGGVTPVVSYMGPALAGLLAGSFVVETIFQIPGLGRFYIQAAFNRDYTMILGTTVFLSGLIIVFNLLADIVLVWLNPQLRQKGGGS